MRELPVLTNIGSYKNNRFNYIQYDMNQFPNKNKRNIGKWIDKEFVVTNKYQKSTYSEIMIFTDEQIENTYLIYTNEYKKYFYDDGRRTDSVFWSFNNNYTDSYKVKVPPAKEQYEKFINDTPKARYLLDYKDDIENWEASRTVIGDIIEVILLESWDYKNETIKYIDSDRFSYEFNDNEYKINIEARNPILAFELKEIEKEKQHNMKEEEVNTYITEYFDQNIDKWMNQISEVVNSNIVKTLVDSFSFILGINYVTMSENNMDCIQLYSKKITTLLASFDYKNTEQTLEMYSSLLNSNIIEGKRVLKEYLLEIIKKYDKNFNEIFTSTKLTKELKKYVSYFSNMNVYEYTKYQIKIEHIVHDYVHKLIKIPPKDVIEKIQNSMYHKLVDAVPIPSLKSEQTITCLGLLSRVDSYESITLLTKENPRLIKYISDLGNWLIKPLYIDEELFDTDYIEISLSIFNNDNRFDDYRIINNCKVLFGGVCITETNISKKEIYIKNFVTKCYVDS